MTKSKFRAACSLIALAVCLLFPGFNDLPVASAQVSPAAGSTYYVSPDGSDAAAGTQAAPFRTIQKAASLVDEGDTVVVRAGRYAGFQLGWDFPHSGTASQPITFKADPGAVIEGRNDETADGINLEGSSYVVIDGFTVDNAREHRSGVHQDGLGPQRHGPQQRCERLRHLGHLYKPQRLRADHRQQHQLQQLGAIR